MPIKSDKTEKTPLLNEQNNPENPHAKQPISPQQLKIQITQLHEAIQPLLEELNTEADAALVLHPIAKPNLEGKSEKQLGELHSRFEKIKEILELQIEIKKIIPTLNQADNDLNYQRTQNLEPKHMLMPLPEQFEKFSLKKLKKLKERQKEAIIDLTSVLDSISFAKIEAIHEKIKAQKELIDRYKKEAYQCGAETLGEINIEKASEKQEFLSVVINRLNNKLSTHEDYLAKLKNQIDKQKTLNKGNHTKLMDSRNTLRILSDETNKLKTLLETYGFTRDAILKLENEASNKIESDIKAKTPKKLDNEFAWKNSPPGELAINEIKINALTNLIKILKLKLTEQINFKASQAFKDKDGEYDTPENIEFFKINTKKPKGFLQRNRRATSPADLGEFLYSVTNTNIPNPENRAVIIYAALMLTLYAISRRSSEPLLTCICQALQAAYRQCANVRNDEENIKTLENSNFWKSQGKNKQGNTLTNYKTRPML